MNNRRNYYRTLKVQPDASIEVIKTNYRAIMQKLKMHPDLGGDEWNASLINIAYNTLRNPEKRAKYDEKLLKQHCIKQISRGHLNTVKTNQSHQDNDINHRNYYRILHVQTDSPRAIILSSFETLSKKETDPEILALLKQAVQVLTNEQQKKVYDQLILKHNHADAINLLKQQTYEKPAAKNNTAKNDALLKQYQSSHAANSQQTSYKPDSSVSTYQPIITQYCSFCKTPHNQSPSIDHAPLCNECSSPLFPPSDKFINQSRRGLTRHENVNTVNIYYDWPGQAHRHLMLDISPTGLKIQSNDQLEKGQILKIDAEDFNAVGEVSYSKQEKAGFHYGVRFLSIMFQRQKGQFFSAKT